MENNMLPGCRLGDLEKTLSLILDKLDDDVWSHPDKPLRKHLLGVYQGCVELSRRYHLPLEDDLLSLTALLHDIYKADSRFQQYIRKEGEGVAHALPSAWLALLIGIQHGMDLRDSLLAAEAIRRHHTNLEDFDSIENKWTEERDFEDLQTIAHVHQLTPSKEWKEALEDFFFDQQGESLEEMWMKLRLLLSVLVTADRLHASGLDVNMALNALPQTIHQPTYREDPINRWRSEVQEMCFQNALKVIDSPGVYSLSLPTGAGKTLLGLKIAHHLVQRGAVNSIIYALPFISIVEQTTHTAAALYGSELVQEDHSLRPIDSEEVENRPIRRMADLFRFWYAPVVLTTVAQLWDAFFAPKANQTMNFHRLSRAVIILDEPQTIVPKYWRELGGLMSFISRELGSYFLLMTATQPLIVDPQEGRKEISPKKISFPQNRHHFTYLSNNEGYVLEELPSLIKEYGLVEKSRGLVLLNTRKAVLDAYDVLAAWVDELAEPIELRVLSTWLTPTHRRKVIDEMRRAEQNGKRIILISTQVIEAGVDLDFDWVIRDFAPIDSIIQAAGRCNRHGKRNEPGKVLIVPFKRKERLTSDSVYDKVLREATKHLLQENPTFEEHNVPEIVERYYEHVAAAISVEPIFEALQRGKWEGAPYLYEKDYLGEVSLIVEETPTVREWIEELEQSRSTLENLTHRKALLQKIQQHTLQVPQSALQKIMECSSRVIMEENTPLVREVLGGSFYLLDKRGIGVEPQHVYHPCKGFIPMEGAETEALIF